MRWRLVRVCAQRVFGKGMASQSCSGGLAPVLLQRRRAKRPLHDRDDGSRRWIRRANEGACARLPWLRLLQATNPHCDQGSNSSTYRHTHSATTTNSAGGGRTFFIFSSLNRTRALTRGSNLISCSLRERQDKEDGGKKQPEYQSAGTRTFRRLP